MGIEHFSKITAGDYSQVSECFNGFPWSLTEDGSHENGNVPDDDDSDDDFVQDLHYTDDFDVQSD